MAEHIRVERNGDVTTLRLDNPAAMNAMDGDMADALHARLEEAGRSSRAILLAGHPRAFCAGANLAANTASPETSSEAQSFDAGARLESSFNPLVSAIRSCPVPIIAAVSGAVAGIGTSIALACDMIVAGESAYFLQAFRRIGLVPDGGAAFLLGHAIGRVRAMELMLLGEKLPAATALVWGLINRVVADDALETQAASIAASLAAGPTRTLGMIRQLAWAGLSSSWETQLQAERDMQREAGRTHDFAEGVSAFFAKREARFTGR